MTVMKYINSDACTNDGKIPYTLKVAGFAKI